MTCGRTHAKTCLETCLKLDPEDLRISDLGQLSELGYPVAKNAGIWHGNAARTLFFPNYAPYFVKQRKGTTSKSENRKTNNNGEKHKGEKHKGKSPQHLFVDCRPSPGGLEKRISSM